MGEEYEVINPWAVWRRRLLIGVMLIAIVALAFVGDFVYQNWRLSTGPTAWYMVETTGTTRAQESMRHELVIGDDSFPTEQACTEYLSKLPGGSGPMPSCRRLLVDDANKMRRY